MKFNEAARSIDTLVNGILGRVRSGTIGMCENMIAELPAKTPVDTGAARSNWRIVGSSSKPVVPSNVINPHFPGFLLGIDETANRFRTTLEGRKALATIQSSVSKLSDIHIVIFNNAEHIGLLNMGWSDQAAAGFVDAAVLKSASSIRF